MNPPGDDEKECTHPQHIEEIFFEGSHSIDMDAGQLWHALNDPEILQHCIHGCSSLEKAGATRYLAVFGVQIGPVRKDFTGQLSVVDVRPPSQYRLHSILDAGRAGLLEGGADVNLTALSETQTRLEYSARVSASGWLSRLGRRLLGGAAQKYMDRFFARLEVKVRERG